MLEYNADTPSLQIESGVLTQEWRNAFKQFPATYYSVNYLDDAIRQFTPKLKEECKVNQYDLTVTGLGLLINTWDEENMAVMQYFHSIFSSMFKQ